LYLRAAIISNKGATVNLYLLVILPFLCGLVSRISELNYSKVLPYCQLVILPFLPTRIILLFPISETHYINYFCKCKAFS
jgi:hypothetical protein